MHPCPCLPVRCPLCCCRWFYEKALATFSSWSSVRAALLAARPSPWGALVLLMIGSFVKSVVEQFAQVGTWATAALRSGWLAPWLAG